MKGNEMLLSLWFSWVWFRRYKVKAQNEVFKRSFKHKQGSSQKKIKEGGGFEIKASLWFF